MKSDLESAPTGGSTKSSSGISLAGFLPYQLSITSRAVSGRIALEYRTQFDLGVPEWRVVAVLGEVGPLTQRDMVCRTTLDKVAVNRACRGLEARQLVAREPNTQDGRSHLLALTAQGRALFERIMHLALELEQEVFAGFSDTDLAQFRAVLDTLRTRAVPLGQPERGGATA